MFSLFVKNIGLYIQVHRFLLFFKWKIYKLNQNREISTWCLVYVNHNIKIFWIIFFFFLEINSFYLIIPDATNRLILIGWFLGRMWLAVGLEASISRTVLSTRLTITTAWRTHWNLTTVRPLTQNTCIQIKFIYRTLNIPLLIK